MLKEKLPELTKIYEEAMAIELPDYVPGGVNKEADSFLKLRNQYEKMVTAMDIPYEEIQKYHAEHYRLVSMRDQIDKKLKDYMMASRKIVEAMKQK